MDVSFMKHQMLKNREIIIKDIIRNVRNRYISRTFITKF